MLPSIPLFKSPEQNRPEIPSVATEMSRVLDIATNNVIHGYFTEHPAVVTETPEFEQPTPQEQVAAKIIALDSVRRASNKVSDIYDEVA